MIRLAIAGAMGRMGRAVLEAAAESVGVEIAAALSGPPTGSMGSRFVRVGEREFVVSESLSVACDVLVEFAGAEGSMAWLEVCRSRRIPLVMGSTGHTDEQRAAVRNAVAEIPIVASANFSLGIQVLLECVARMRSVFGWEYDVEIVETHHRNKVDAPSGTALSVVEAIQAADSGTHGRTQADVVFGRKGRDGERGRGQIGVHAVRMGDIVGQHEIHFSGPGETITVRHSASSRLAFAQGALRAAEWIVGKKPGLYSMRDVMGGR